MRQLHSYSTDQLKSLVALGLLCTDIVAVDHFFTFSNRQPVVLPEGLRQYRCQVSHAYLLNGNEFWKMSTLSQVPDGKAYLEWPDAETFDQAPARISFGNDATALEGIHGTEQGGRSLTDGQWFDMQGRRIAQPSKAGLYIHNGKKVVVK